MIIVEKSISTSLTFAILLIAKSCRKQDDFVQSANDIKQNRLIYKRGSDSVQADSTQLAQYSVIGCPLPKNGHHW